MIDLLFVCVSELDGNLFMQPRHQCTHVAVVTTTRRSEFGVTIFLMLRLRVRFLVQCPLENNFCGVHVLDHSQVSCSNFQRRVV